VTTAYRQTDTRVGFFWALGMRQPAGRWHDDEGPTQYLSDTPDGAWAEFLRHEEIREAEDLQGVCRDLWAIEVTDPPHESPDLPDETTTGPPHTYPACRSEARRLRGAGASGLRAPSAALRGGVAFPHRSVGPGLEVGPARAAHTLVLFGEHPDLDGWRLAAGAAPPASLLATVHHLDEA
jgi:hypothetical protein